MTRIDRRILLLGGAATAGALAIPSLASAKAPNPFTLGVASGEPDTESVVLWTRLASSPLDSDGHGGMSTKDVSVQWQVATTEKFSTIVAHGTVTAHHRDAHAVHVVAGGLKPGHVYYYRFKAKGHVSPVGRTRTTPALDTYGGTLRMAFASCSHYEAGYFTAYRRMAQDHPDVILHLGDYIYEAGVGKNAVRTHAGKAEIVSLASYRRRYAQYHTDADLKAAHAAAPWLVIPDDHEVENNYAGMIRANDKPALTTAEWKKRRAAAYQAYYENMPLRPRSKPDGNSIRLYRRLRWGKLVTFHMLDTRQFRTNQPCGDEWKVCGAADAASQTMTGATQEKWLLDGLAQRYGRWDVLAQQILFARWFDEQGGGYMDSWDGYRAARARLQQGWRNRNVRNPVVLTGDTHRAWANDLKANYAEPNSAVIGTELACTSITSDGNGNGNETAPYAAENPHIRWYSERRGYTLASVTPTEMRADFRTIDSVSKKDAAVHTRKSFIIHDGRPGITKA
ncbi:alkaline phosphatase D family protein [Actinoplanes sp. NPDC051851]|uniref:alkaline phosphatase D family protein n=1 Tax=Actinoplanes sp. NPDC051851 TaxID=3154753 RepID=UPI003432717C